MIDKLISAVFWFFGITIIARGISLLSESILGGLFFIITGIILLPVFHKKVRSILNRPVQDRWFVLIAFILLTFSGFFIQSSDKHALENGTASPELVEREKQLNKQREEQNKLNEQRAAENKAAKEQREIQRQNIDQEVEIQTESRLALLNFLKDPDSADIRNHKGNCGEVNSKNGFGGYTGFKHFIANRNIVAVEGENMDTDEFQKAWGQICK